MNAAFPPEVPAPNACEKSKEGPPRSGPEIIGHRGASSDAPENTLTAFQLAYAQGADAVELDLRLTRDGQLAVIHDATTRRVAGVSRTVAQRTMAELRRLEVGQWGKWKDRGFTQRIPSLPEVLACVPTGKRLFIELKCGAEILLELRKTLQRTDPHQIVIVGFDYQTVSAAKISFPSIDVCWVSSCRKGARKLAALDRLVRGAQRAGLDGLDLETGFGIDPPLVDRVHRAGLLLYTWTVDAPAEALKQAASGVDGITSNRPGWLRQQIVLLQSDFALWRTRPRP